MRDGRFEFRHLANTMQIPHKEGVWWVWNLLLISIYVNSIFFWIPSPYGARLSDQTGSTLKHFGAGWGSEIWDPSVTSICPPGISGLSSVCEFLCFFTGKNHRISHWMILDKPISEQVEPPWDETSVMEMMQDDARGRGWVLQSCLKPLMVLRHGFCRQKTRPLLLNFTKDNDGRALREHIQIKHHQNPSNNYSFNGLGFSLSNFSLEGWQPRSQFEILWNRGLELAFSSILQAEFRSALPVSNAHT